MTLKKHPYKTRETGAALVKEYYMFCYRDQWTFVVRMDVVKFIVVGFPKRQFGHC